MHRSYQTISFGPGGRLPPGIRWLLVANGVVFLLQSVLDLSGGRSPFSAHTPAWEGLIDWLGLSPADAILGFRLWQPVTYLFLHGDLFHVGFNMLLLWMFGTHLERQWGTRLFLRYYFLCGVGAALFTCVFAFGSTTIGASGAIFGLLLAYGYLWPDRLILIWGIIPLKARTMVWLFGGLQLYYLVFGRGQGGIAYAAHLGGMVVGYLYLRRAWRLGPLLTELKWKLRRRRFRVMGRSDDDFPFH